MRGKWFISPHAVHRYIERLARSLTYEQALDDLVAYSETAHYVKDWKPGVELWKGPKPRRLRFLIGHREDGAPQLITVMGGKDPAYRK